MTVTALIVAAGRGKRSGGDVPKQYQAMAGKSILRHTLERFVSHPKIDAIRVVIHPDDIQHYQEAVDGLSILEPIFGGQERQDSVRMGLESLQEIPPSIILVHDAARPFINHDVIDRVLEGCKKSTAVIPVLPVTDTIKRVENQQVKDTVERKDLMRVQTPQGFGYKALLAAHQQASSNMFSDDAALIEAAGQIVTIVAGSEENIKITSQNDIKQAVMRMQETRTAMGYDVHAFSQEGNNVRLCGVDIPHDYSLKGHSDADVGLHALTDALLGSIAAEDIGVHFPPSDDKWKAADSSLFLRHAVSLLQDKQGQVKYVDITLICESPKILPYREMMKERLASWLEISPARVSIKATTTEGLGFTGRREGIAAQAVVTVILPVGEDND